MPEGRFGYRLLSDQYLLLQRHCASGLLYTEQRIHLLRDAFETNSVSYNTYRFN